MLTIRHIFLISQEYGHILRCTRLEVRLTRMISTNAYSELLAVLYAAPLDQIQWQNFLDRLCKITGSVVVFFLRNDSTLGAERLALGGGQVPSDLDLTYRSAYTYSDPIRQAFMQNPRLGYIDGEDLISHDELLKSEVHQTMATPYGVEYFSLLVVSISPRSQEVITLWRGPERPRLEPEHQELLELLLPHLQNVGKIRRVLGMAEERALNAEALLNANATASILLDGKGRLIYMNEAAQNLALASEGYFVQNDRIVPVDPSKRSQFAALVANSATVDASRTRDDHAYGGALILPRKGRKRPLQVFVTPLRLTDPHRTTVRTLVLVTDPDRAVNFPDTILRQLYGLTPAETEVANGLLNGYSLDEIARLRDVSLTTIRTQMSSLLAKTSTRRQGDLIRLLASLPKIVPAAS